MSELETEVVKGAKAPSKRSIIADWIDRQTTKRRLIALGGATAALVATVVAQPLGAEATSEIETPWSVYDYDYDYDVAGPWRIDIESATANEASRGSVHNSGERTRSRTQRTAAVSDTVSFDDSATTKTHDKKAKHEKSKAHVKSKAHANKKAKGLIADRGHREKSEQQTPTVTVLLDGHLAEHYEAGYHDGYNDGKTHYFDEHLDQEGEHFDQVLEDSDAPWVSLDGVLQSANYSLGHEHGYNDGKDAGLLGDYSNNFYNPNSWEPEYYRGYDDAFVLGFRDGIDVFIWNQNIELSTRAAFPNGEDQTDGDLSSHEDGYYDGYFHGKQAGLELDYSHSTFNPQSNETSYVHGYNDAFEQGFHDGLDLFYLEEEEEEEQYSEYEAVKALDYDPADDEHWEDEIYEDDAYYNDDYDPANDEHWEGD